MKASAVIALAILVIGGGVFALTSGGDTVEPEAASQQQVTEQTESTPIQQQTASPETETEPAQAQEPATTASEPASEGSYVDYSDTAIADAAGTTRVLFFHASWCPTCNAFEDDIQAQGVPAGVTIIQANFDNDTSLKQQYGVNLQSTFVQLDDSGDAVMTWPFGRGLQGISDLYAQL